MESYLRIGLLIIAAVIISMMLYESRKRRPKKNNPEDITEDLVIMNVLAKQSQTFASYDLLQALAAAGMQYGEMKIFHYYHSTPKGKVKLFSLASATNPGYFDMDNMGELACKGLTLFMRMSEIPDPEYAFELMLNTAEQLADDLEGDLFTGQRQRWNENTVTQYRQQVLAYGQQY